MGKWEELLAKLRTKEEEAKVKEKEYFKSSVLKKNLNGTTEKKKVQTEM